ncbi:hypothetical protein ACFYPZ_37660 [Streptomyces sp. NPDC005506]|uniref:hypothetical protein n=1 Tax=unclassified Streptomyces TaxID=2593676 RepID=UPI0036BC0360
MPLAITSPWRRLGRVGLCLADATGRYLLTWVAAWLVYALTAPRQHELESYLPRIRSYWEDTAYYLRDDSVAWVGLMVRIPSLLIILLFGLLNERKGAAFRFRLAGLLLLPTWFLLFQDFVALLFVPVLAQVVFALCLMPVPLVRFPVQVAN